jgi:hypothetical protein
MKKRMLTIIVGMFLISLASSMYAGTNYSFIIETTDNLFWDALGNSSNMEGFQVFQEINGSQSIITFSADLRMKPDNFTILLYSNTSNEIEVIKEIPVYSGGGGHTRIITKETIKEVPNYVTEYLDNETIEIREVEKEVTETEYKIPFVGYILMVIGGIVLIIWIIKLFQVKETWS